jgi:hypothetical protein
MATPVHAPQVTDDTAPAFRGPLRYEIETASAQLEAGAPFSIFVRIGNPYDVPVTILAVKSLLPSEFKDPDEPDPSWRERLSLKSVVEAPLELVATSLQPVGEGEKAEAVPGPVLLQPGNTALRKFTAKTRESILFSPSLYTFHVEIHYEINGKANLDAVKQQFNVRSPLNALVYGSFWGALTGASLHGLKENLGDLTKLLSLYSIAAPVAGVLIGAVVVVAFARKKDAQPFITVEDFYGGFFVGFLAGYVGFPLLDSITSLPK